MSKLLAFSTFLAPTEAQGVGIFVLCSLVTENRRVVSPVLIPIVHPIGPHDPDHTGICPPLTCPLAPADHGGGVMIN